MPERKRYARQTILPGVGEEGQAKLAAASVLIVGCGGLGVPVATYLAGAGVGELVLVDGDTVSVSNLHRQVIYHTDQAGPKARLLAEHCSKLNPGTHSTGSGTARVRAHETYLDATNAQPLVEAATLVLDCTDHAPTKHLLADACHLFRTPLVYAAALRFSGYLALFPNAGPDAVHLRDLYPEPDPSLPDCATAGILPTAVGTIGLLQANAALCFLLGIGEPPVDTLLTYDALTNRQHRLRIRKTYHKPVSPPWQTTRPTRADLETDNADPAAYTTVFSLLDERREPDLPEGVVRITPRNPLQQCFDRMEPGKQYLLYCQTGVRSLVLAGQIVKARPDVSVKSLRGGKR